ncbi:MAG: EAL domain-containing protein [Thiobacillaceae bacterium]|jgi:diguanylate cyclase (GGDEF)-like protein/PAS domain S-box-containing protein|nr:EAL domain-containing protein [Thiobacillaceae bacterium]
MKGPALSLRTRLILATVVVEVVMLGLLVANSTRLMNDSLLAQAGTRVAELNTLFNAALGAPMAQRDYATIDGILAESRREDGVAYLVLRDRAGRVVASTGWRAGAALPAASPSLDLAKAVDGRFHLSLPIRLAGQEFGSLHYGLSTDFLTEARTHLIRQSLPIAALAVVVSVLLLTVLGVWLTRHLSALTNASQAVAQGDFDTLVPVSGRDEVGQLANAFNRMTRAVRERVEALQESEGRFHAIANFTYDLELWLAPDGRLLWINPSVRRMLGYSQEECLAMPDFPLGIIRPADREAARQKLAGALRGEAGAGFEFGLCRKDGGELEVSVNWQPIHDRDGGYLGLRASLRDVTALKRAQQELRQALAELGQSEATQRRYAQEAGQERARLVSLLSAMNLGILFIGADGRVVYHNPAFKRIWMIRDDAKLVGLPATEVLAHASGLLSRPDQFSRHVLNVLETHEVSDDFEIPLADGRLITQLNYPVRDQDGRLIGHLWIHEDVTRERQTADQLAYLAERDALTGLYNRHRFQQELARMVADCERGGHRGALLFFDLDEFKVINDSFGHRAGDALLIRVAGEVSALVRRNEVLARLGGDEFALLVPNAHEEEIVQLAERIVRAVAAIPFRFEGQNLRLTSSLGIALYPTHAIDADQLVAHADAAMYQSKQAGKNTWRVYRADLDTTRSMVAHLTWNDRIAHALENGLLRLHFQGIYAADGRTLTHLEALVRMVDEQNPAELIMPGRFIPVAEKNGKVLDIDRWVLAESIRRLRDHAGMPPVAVNISGRSFDDPSLPQYIADLLREHGVAPHRLMVELTETSAVTDLADAQRFIEALRATGCGTCLDDFGSGFSSFAYLKHLQVDTVKIDGLFIRNLPADRDNQVFVKAIVDVARGMGKRTIAEFVEDARTLDMLRDYGVDMVQGYHLDTPRADHPGLAGART